jgi:GDP-4-dehydro-6-deoxy-D-mannose reductase
MRILLTGITSYLGSHLANALLNGGYEVVGLKRQSSSLQRNESILPNVMLYNLDETNLTIQLKKIGMIDGVNATKN